MAHLLQAFLAQGFDQLVQASIQFDGSDPRRKRATHRLRLTRGLVPLTVADLPQVQGQLPAQHTRQRPQIAHPLPHRADVTDLLLAESPDHPIQPTPAHKATALLKDCVRGLGLHAAAPDQDSVLRVEPVLRAQIGGNGLDLFRFANDQQQADFAMP
ncbi:hypothetical protein D3C76_1384090 [compost metagenome]